MSEEQEKKSLSPVLTGLIALLAVSLTVGLVLAGVALVGSRVLGLSDDSDGSAGATPRESAVIPKPSHTAGSGPQVTLDTEPPASEDTGFNPGDAETSKTKKPKPDKAITLQAGQTAVGNFQRIDLSGVYPGGEGAILQVQRFENGAWAEFDATIPVSNETFTTYVQSAMVGVNKFRVIDNSTGDASNPITVTVG